MPAKKAAALQAKILTKDQTFSLLRVELLNSPKQYNRKRSVWIKNLPLWDGGKANTTLVIGTDYRKVLLPILQGALLSHLIKKILEASKQPTAFPTKIDNRPKPNIQVFVPESCVCSFSASSEILPPPQPPPPPSSSHHYQPLLFHHHPGKKMFRYPIYEDLNTDTAGPAHGQEDGSGVDHQWIHYMLTSNTAIKMVSSVYDSIIKIINLSISPFQPI
jgi:hypothetical protein